MAASILHKIGHLVRIPPLLSGDQPFVSWHSIDNVFLFINYEHTTWPRRWWADVQESSFTPCSGQMFYNHK